MAVFNFGIGIQLEGTAAAGVESLTVALNGLNAAFQQVQQDAPDLTNLAAGAIEAADATAQAAQQNQELRGSIQEVTAANRADGDAAAARIRRLEDGYQQISNAVNDHAEDLDYLGGVGNRVSRRIADDFVHSFSRMSRAGHKMGVALVGMLESLQDIFTVGGASDSEDMMVRLNAQLGRGRAEAKGMLEQTTAISQALSITPEQASALADALITAGAGVDSLGDKATETAARMVGVFRIDPAAVAEATQSARFMGVALEDVANTSAQLGEISGVPKLIEQLPGAIGFARQAQAEFALTIGKSGKQITGDVQRMTAFYAKALGKSAPEAARLAQETFQRFAKGLQQNRDVFLGLADDFDPLTTAMLEAGMGFDEAEDLMSSAMSGGADGQLKFLKQIQSMKENLDPLVFQRFYRQLQNEGGEAVNQLLTLDAARIDSLEDLSTALGKQQQAEADAAAERESHDPQVKAIREQTKAFEEMSDSMRNSVAGWAEITANQQKALIEQLRMDASDGVIKGLKDVSSLFSKINDTVKVLGEKYGPQLEQLQPIIAGIVTAAGAGGTALTALGAVAAPIKALAFGLEGASDAGAAFFRIMSGSAASSSAASGAATSTSRAFAFLSGAAKIAGTSVALIAAGGEPAAEAMRKLNDASMLTKDSGERVGNVLGALTTGTLQTLDNLLLGFPSKLLGVDDGFESLGKSITELFTGLPDKIETAVTKMFTWLSDPTIWMPVLKSFGKAAAAMVEALWELPSGAASALQSLQAFAFDTLASITKGILRAFGADGSTIESVSLGVDYIKLAYATFFASVRAGFDVIALGAAAAWLKTRQLFGAKPEETEGLERYIQDKKAEIEKEGLALVAMTKKIDERESKMAEMRAQEKRIADAGGEDAYRLQQIREKDRAAAIEGGRRMVGQAGAGFSEDALIAIFTQSKQTESRRMANQQIAQVKPVFDLPTRVTFGAASGDINRQPMTSALPPAPPVPGASASTTDSKTSSPTTVPAVGASAGTVPATQPSAAQDAPGPGKESNSRNVSLTLKFNDAPSRIAQAITTALREAGISAVMSD